MNVSPIIKYRTLAIAKALAPVDTGNLRHNAITLKNVKPDSWTIEYNTMQANYIEPLEEGYVHHITGEIINTHKGFIRGSAMSVANYLLNVFEGKPQKTQGFRKIALSTAQNNQRRELVNLRSKMNYSEVRKLMTNSKDETTQVFPNRN